MISKKRKIIMLGTFGVTAVSSATVFAISAKNNKKNYNTVSLKKEVETIKKMLNKNYEMILINKYHNEIILKKTNKTYIELMIKLNKQFEIKNNKKNWTEWNIWMNETHKMNDLIKKLHIAKTKELKIMVITYYITEYLIYKGKQTELNVMLYVISNYELGQKNI